ncbi:MAG TPA: ATP-binding protein [Steroidobacteraceae bacterium]|nr:ATP-binding protein [Steroidobacteraceae bacterium]
MSTVTIIWSTIAACSLLLAFMYGVVWALDRKAWSSLVFSLDALALVGTAVLEMQMMTADSPESWGMWVRWIQIPIFLRAACIVIFIRLFFGTGRPWLMWTIIGMRLFIMVTGFIVDPNFNFSHIDSIARVPFLGDQVTVVGVAGARNLQWIATLELTLMLVYVADASIQLWRRGDREARRKVLVIGVAAFATNLLESLYSQLMILMGLQLPALLSPPYLLMLAAMTVEMSRDTLRASRLARELKDSQQRLDDVAASAGVGLWTWNARNDRLWMTQRAREMFGLGWAGDGEVDMQQLRGMIEPDEFDRVRKVWEQAANAGAEQEVQFRINAPDGGTRWLVAHGRSERDPGSDSILAQGVLREVTDQWRARQENEELRRELAHAGRVSALGTLSSSLIHELSQPLGAIQLNADAAELLLNRPNPDLTEIRQILADIRRDDQRAGEVIEGLRKFLKRRQMDFGPVSVENLVADVASLLKSDALMRHVTLECTTEPGLPPVRGDKVHLSQVLINLLMNGMDAVAELPPPRRHVRLHARRKGEDGIEIEVADSGPGISRDALGRIFDPFFTTKTGGMGIGLSVSQSIVQAHQGKLSAENRADGGARFVLTLPKAA